MSYTDSNSIESIAWGEREYSGKKTSFPTPTAVDLSKLLPHVFIPYRQLLLCSGLKQIHMLNLDRVSSQTKTNKQTKKHTSSMSDLP